MHKFILRINGLCKNELLHCTRCLLHCTRIGMRFVRFCYFIVHDNAFYFTSLYTIRVNNMLIM